MVKLHPLLPRKQVLEQTKQRHGGSPDWYHATDQTWSYLKGSTPLVGQRLRWGLRWSPIPGQEVGAGLGKVVAGVGVSAGRWLRGNEASGRGGWVGGGGAPGGGGGGGGGGGKGEVVSCMLSYTDSFFTSVA
jgi:hypothetical protein